MARKISTFLRLQLVGWSIYWILLLLLNLLFYRNKDYGTGLLIVWTVLFTASGIGVFYFLTRLYNWLIRSRMELIPSLILMIIFSFFGAYIWGLFEPLI